MYQVEGCTRSGGAERESRPAMSMADEDTIFCIFTPTQGSSPPPGRRQQTLSHTFTRGTRVTGPRRGKGERPTTRANGTHMLMLFIATLAATQACGSTRAKSRDTLLEFVGRTRWPRALAACSAYMLESRSIKWRKPSLASCCSRRVLSSSICGSIHSSPAIKNPVRGLICSRTRSPPSACTSPSPLEGGATLRSSPPAACRQSSTGKRPRTRSNFAHHDTTDATLQSLAGMPFWPDPPQTCLCLTLKSIPH